MERQPRDFNVVFEWEDGIRTWTSFVSKAHFESRRGEIGGRPVRIGVSREYAILFSRQVDGITFARHLHEQVMSDPEHWYLHFENAFGAYWDEGPMYHRFVSELIRLGYEDTLRQLKHI